MFYIWDMPYKNSIWLHLHVWIGLAFIVVAVIKSIVRRNLIKSQLGLNTSKGGLRYENI